MTKDALQHVLDAVNRAGIGHNNKAGGQWLLVSTDDQLVALRAALTATTNEAAAQADGRGVTKIDPGFRWDHEAKHHVPTLMVEFTPCPMNSGSESRGWKDRDALAAALATQPVQAQGEAEPVTVPADYLQGHADGLEWAALVVEAEDPRTGDWLHDDRNDLAEAIRRGPDMPPAAPAVDRGLSEANEVREALAELLREVEDVDTGTCPLTRERARRALAASAPRQAEPQWVALPYASPIELWKAFKAGAKFVLHYHGKTFDVTRMEPREHVVYVQPPGMPVKVYPDGRNCESAGDAIWLEQIATTPSQAGSCQASGEWATVEVNQGFPALMEALDRAARKGYMPDAMTAEWEAFEYRLPFSDHASATPAGRTLTDVVNSMPITWELSWGSEDEESPCNWRVHDRRGPRNDREWELIGEGPTPADAILAASSTTVGERE